MSVLVLAVALAMAFVLLWAALEKARSLPSVAAVLRQLGMRERSARVAALLLVAVELTVALGLIFRPRSPATLAGLLGLAAAFAIAGLIALRRNEKIRCSCFGPHSDTRLGKSQLRVFPLWLCGAALLWLTGPAHASDLQPASLLVVLALTLASMRGASSLKAAHEARGDRRSAREMFVWLNR